MKGTSTQEENRASKKKKKMVPISEEVKMKNWKRGVRGRDD